MIAEIKRQLSVAANQVIGMEGIKTPKEKLQEITAGKCVHTYLYGYHRGKKEALEDMEYKSRNTSFYVFVGLKDGHVEQLTISASKGKAEELWEEYTGLKYDDFEDDDGLLFMDAKDGSDVYRIGLIPE